MAESKIEWTDYTFNPWWGCERVSPGCAHCYADTLATRYGYDIWGPGHGFRFFGDKHWAQPLNWNRKAERDGVRRRVFCASMADVFEERAELDEHRIRLMHLIETTPSLDWQLLTKRPHFARDWLQENDPWSYPELLNGWMSHSRDGLGWYLPSNIWLGVSIENSRYTWRADVLRQIPAAVRFISAEPLLGSLYEGRRVNVQILGGCSDGLNLPVATADISSAGDTRKPLDLTGIDWVIIGGESGPGARPFHLEHAREIMQRCMWGDMTPCGDGCCEPQWPRPAVFVKQFGAKPVDGTGYPMNIRDRAGRDMDEWPFDLRIREFPQARMVPA